MFILYHFFGKEFTNVRGIDEAVKPNLCSARVGVIRSCGQSTLTALSIKESSTAIPEFPK
jgi:hypothetical protein